MGTIVVSVVLAVLAVAAVSIYNRIITLENRYEHAWSQIDVQFKRRNDLVSNPRKAMMSAGTIAESAQAANELSGALGRLFAVAEAYPELRANENFRALQDELSSVEDKIAYARQFYNDAVLQYNNAIETVPGVLLAGPMGKSEQVFLEIPETEREVPAVSFS